MELQWMPASEVSALTCQSTRTHNSRRRLRRECWWSGHFYVMSHRRSAPSVVRIHNPLLRRKARWPSLSKPELRLLMAGLADWELRSRGPSRTRIRRKRQDAVAFYRRKFGALGDDRLWVAARLPSETSSWRATRPHNPRREQERGVLWSET